MRLTKPSKKDNKDGSYETTTFLTSNGVPTSKERATRAVTRTFDKRGKLIEEIWLAKSG